jgi:short-subunit dehydrogenase
MSSLASVIPAPTRSLYAASKSSALLLYESLAIEHPSITFSLMMPSTIKGDFRSSAVDGGSVRDTSPGLSQKGLDKGYVAKKCVEAIDYRKKHVFLPGFHGVSHLLYWLFPSFVEARAREKYQFIPKPSSF